MLTRAVLAFVALPGIVAFVVPALVLRTEDATFHRAGWLPLAVGTLLLLRCVQLFYREGRGTLAPWDPPRRLVRVGPYRWSRNPMYVAVVLVLSGWALGYQSRVFVIYGVVVALAFHLRIVFGEEPWLARTHGDEWVDYKARVPRWLGFPRRR